MTDTGIRARVWAAMEQTFAEFPWGIEHTRQVLARAEQLLDGEGVADPAERQRITLAVILHDIGLPAAQRLHGSMAGPYQEAEGAILAEQILADAGAPDAARIVYLVAHHHTQSAIDGRDFQLLWEADFLVNAPGMTLTGEQLAAAISEHIRTATGKRLAGELLTHQESA